MHSVEKTSSYAMYIIANLRRHSFPYTKTLFQRYSNPIYTLKSSKYFPKFAPHGTLNLPLYCFTMEFQQLWIWYLANSSITFHAESKALPPSSFAFANWKMFHHVKKTHCAVCLGTGPSLAEWQLFNREKRHREMPIRIKLREENELCISKCHFSWSSVGVSGYNKVISRGNHTVVHCINNWFDQLKLLCLVLNDLSDELLGFHYKSNQSL